MKKIEELTANEYQEFLNYTFEDIEAKFERVILDSTDEYIGIEYSVKSMDMEKCFISISNPDLLIWLYNKNVDISEPLDHLKYDYNEMDETNSILIEYAMEVGRIIQKEHNEEFNHNESNYMSAMIEIEKIQRDLINKI